MSENERGAERRFLVREVRVSTSEGGQSHLVGYGAVFNQLSEDLGGFREMILPGAFSDVLSDDVRSLLNHDMNLILGRNVSGTLDLTEDNVGLRYDVILPGTSYANDLIISVERGDVDQSSFGFRVLEDSWVHPTEEQPLPVRKIHKFQRLYDVGPVAMPAYTGTSVSVRALDKAKELTVPGGATEAEAAQIAARRRDLLRRHLDLLEL